jgi:hypothetical protein
MKKILLLLLILISKPSIADVLVCDFLAGYGKGGTYLGTDSLGRSFFNTDSYTMIFSFDKCIVTKPLMQKVNNKLK